MSDKFVTVDILRDATVQGRVWTPQQRIVPDDVARELVAQKAAIIIKPDTTEEQILAAESKAIAAAERPAK